MNFSRSVVLCLVLASFAPAWAATTSELAAVFRPFETDQVTLSPDGARVAYTERRDDQLILVIRDLTTNKSISTPLGFDRAPDLSGQREKTPARLTHLSWATADRLVFSLRGENIWSLRADGSEPKRLTDERDFRALPVVPGIGGQPVQGMQSILHRMSRPAVRLPAESDAITIVASPRGAGAVYVEAIDWSKLPIDPDARRTMMDLGGPPRVVYRHDVTTGARREIGEAEPTADALMTDRQGRPRIARRALSQGALHTVFVYSSVDGGAWRSLDEYLGRDLALNCTISPDNQLAERSVPLGFDEDPNLLYFASNVGRNTFGVYALDLKAKRRTALAVESAEVDLIDPLEPIPQPLVFDDWKHALVGVRCVGRERTTVWLDPALAAVQKTIDGADPTRTWEIVEWDQDRSTFLIRGTSQSEPGVYAVFQTEENALSEFTSRAPWLGETDRNPGRSFQFESKMHGMLSGYLTLPRHPILKKPPLVVLCHNGPWARNYPGYDREAQALATMGFIVLQVNYRGSVGFGRKHLDALRDGIDRVAAEDIAEALDVMAPPEVDRRLIAIMGQGYGGYVALRALQLYPERFRCGVVLDAITDLDIWANPPSNGPSFAGELRRQFVASDPNKNFVRSIATHAGSIKAPVFVIEAADNFRLGGHDLAGRLARQNAETRFLGLDANDAAPLPQARAALFGKIQDFLNTNVYNYAVKIGALNTVEQK